MLDNNTLQLAKLNGPLDALRKQLISQLSTYPYLHETNLNLNTTPHPPPHSTHSATLAVLYYLSSSLLWLKSPLANLTTEHNLQTTFLQTNRLNSPKTQHTLKILMTIIQQDVFPLNVYLKQLSSVLKPQQHIARYVVETVVYLFQNLPQNSQLNLHDNFRKYLSSLSSNLSLPYKQICMSLQLQLPPNKPENLDLHSLQLLYPQLVKVYHTDHILHLQLDNLPLYFMKQKLQLLNSLTK